MYGDNPANSKSSLDCKEADYLLGEDFFVTEPADGSLEDLVVNTGTSGKASDHKREPANQYSDISDDEDSGWATSLSGHHAMFGHPTEYPNVTWTATFTRKSMELESEHTSEQTNPEEGAPNNNTCTSINTNVISEYISKTQIQKLTLPENLKTHSCL